MRRGNAESKGGAHRLTRAEAGWHAWGGTRCQACWRAWLGTAGYCKAGPVCCSLLCLRKPRCLCRSDSLGVFVLLESLLGLAKQVLMVLKHGHLWRRWLASLVQLGLQRRLLSSHNLLRLEHVKAQAQVLVCAQLQQLCLCQGLEGWQWHAQPLSRSRHVHGVGATRRRQARSRRKARLG